jgi:DNA-binding transcriptional regulator/RsmH inhibitor MraZ
LKGFYCFPSFVAPALEAFGEALLMEFQQRLGNVDPLFSEDYDAQRQAWSAKRSFSVSTMKGRVRLPDELIAHAGIGERVLFVGMVKKFQIWDPERFEPIRRERIARGARHQARHDRCGMSGAHVPVMLEEVIAVLRPRDDAIYVDGTFGGWRVCGSLTDARACRVYGIDRDPEAIARGHEMAKRFDGRLTLIHGRFSEMDELLDAGAWQRLMGVALDIGVSSFQFDEAERGFSFSSDGPLDMRMDPSRGQTAADLVNTLPEGALADILHNYGEEKRARSLARAIVAARPLQRTGELAEIAEKVLGPRGAENPSRDAHFPGPAHRGER